MFRSCAGQAETLSAYLKKTADAAAAAEDNDDEEIVVDPSTVLLAGSRDSAHNSHWLADGEGGPSRYVGYYDAASLYPSSGEPASQPPSFFLFADTLPPPRPTLSPPLAAAAAAAAGGWWGCVVWGRGRGGGSVSA